MHRLLLGLPVALLVIASPVLAQRQNPAMLRDFSNADPAKKSGNGGKFVTTTGAQISGRCVMIDANGNHVGDAYPCLSPPPDCTGANVALQYTTAAGFSCVSIAVGGGGAILLNAGGDLLLNGSGDILLN